MRTALKVLFGLVLVGVAAVVMLVFALRSIAHNVHVQETGKDGQKTVHVSSPFGNVTLHENDQLDPERVGIPIYPGAVRSKNRGGVDVQYDAGDLHKNVTVAGASYTTDDDPEKVRDFYKQKFPTWQTKWSNGEYEIQSKENGALRTVGIKRENGVTRIGVASVGPPAAN